LREFSIAIVLFSVLPQRIMNHKQEVIGHFIEKDLLHAMNEELE